MTGEVVGGTPYIELRIGERTWKAVIDTGFNADLELPQALFDTVVIRHLGEAVSHLAAGCTTTQDYYLVRLPFDDGMIEATASFVDNNEILVGTALLKDYVLTIDFVLGSVLVQRQA